MWLATNIDPEKASEIYLDRMKIEQSFKDLKSLLMLVKTMSNDLQLTQKMIVRVLITYTIRVLVGERFGTGCTGAKIIKAFFYSFCSD